MHENQGAKSVEGLGLRREYPPPQWGELQGLWGGGPLLPRKFHFFVFEITLPLPKNSTPPLSALRASSSRDLWSLHRHVPPYKNPGYAPIPYKSTLGSCVVYWAHTLTVSQNGTNYCIIGQ